MSRCTSESTLSTLIYSLQPVSYISLALTLGTGAGLLWYYSHVRDKKLSGVLLIVLTLEEPLDPRPSAFSPTPSWRAAEAAPQVVRLGCWG